MNRLRVDIYYNSGTTSLCVLRAGLTLRQNKHVLRESRDKRHHKIILFYQPHIRLKNTPEIKK